MSENNVTPLPEKAPYDACEWCGGGNAHSIACFNGYFICRRCYLSVPKDKRDAYDDAITGRVWPASDEPPF